MAKGYKFKLEGLLKLREFKEKKIKLELGKIVQEITRVKMKLEELSREIDLNYETQHKLWGDNISGAMLRFFPYYLDGKRADVKKNEDLLKELMKKYDEKVSELVKARGETKVIDKMKEKDFIKYKKHIEKKQQEDIEELFLQKLGGS